MTNDSQERLGESQEESTLTIEPDRVDRTDMEDKHHEISSHEEEKKCFCGLPRWLFSEMKAVFNLSWTMALVFLFNNLQAPISLLFAGHLGTKELGGVALAGTVIKVAGTTIGAGLATACDTVFSQTFGSGNKKYVGIYLQRSLIVIGLFVLPCWAVFLNSENILRAVGQEAQIARIAGQFTLIYMPALPAMYAYTILARYIRNQGILIPFLIIGICGVVLNTFCQFLFVTALDLGTDGAALGRIAGTYTLGLSTLAYIIISKIYEDTWSGLSVDAFQEWGTFLSLAVFGLLNSFLVWLGFEAGTVLAGTLGDVQLGAQSIIFQLETITFCFAMGNGVGCNIRVGHLLGANKPKQAKRAVIAGYALGCIISVALITILLGLQDFLPMIFSSDSEVIETATSIIPILALYNFFDVIVGCSSGILRGCGRQRRSALIVFCGMYLVGLPTGISLMFLTDLGTAGFWWGITLALFVESILFFVSVIRTDWDKEAEKAQVRAGMKKKLAQKKGAETESTALLKDTTDKLTKYSYTYTTSQSDVHFNGATRLSISQLIFRRTLFVLSMLLILGLGVYCRFFFQSIDIGGINSLCIPNNSSVVNHNNTSWNDTWVTIGNVTLPICVQ